MESALRDGWLSQYEYSFLDQQIQGPRRGGQSNDALDLLEVLRQQRFPSGYRPPPSNVDDLYNLGFYNLTPLQSIATHRQLPQFGMLENPFTKWLRDAQEPGFAGGGMNLAIKTRILNSRLSMIANDVTLAPDDRTVLMAIQVLSVLNWCTPLPGGPAPPILTLTINGWTGAFPAFTPAQQANFRRLGGLFGSGNLVALTRFARQILNPIFGVNPPPGWQWPVFSMMPRSVIGIPSIVLRKTT